MCTKPYVKYPIPGKVKCAYCGRECEEDEMLDSIDDFEKKLCVDCFDKETDKYYPDDEYGLEEFEDDDEDLSDDYYDNGHEEDS